MPSTYHVSRRLTDVSLEFPWEFKPVGKEFFPEKTTPYLQDQYAQMSKANLLGLRDGQPIGDTGLPALVEVVYDADLRFEIPLYGFRNLERWVTGRNSDPSLNYERMRTATLTSAIRHRMEYLRVNQRLRSTSIMTTNKTLLAAERFDNFTSSSSLPITLLQQYRDLIADRNNGRPPNKAMCAIQTLRAISKSEEFKDYGVKYNLIPDQRNIEDGNGIARIIEQMISLPPNSLMVHDATYNAGTLVSASYKKFIGSDFVMAYVEPLGPMSYTATVGWRWQELPAEDTIFEVPNTTETTITTNELRIANATEPQVIKPELAVLIKGCVDTTLSANAALD
jgi:hypothetical protein